MVFFSPIGQLQMFLLSFPETFIIGSSMRRDWLWMRTWGVARPIPPERSIFTTSSWIEVDRHRKLVETWCLMVSIMAPEIEDEHEGLLTVISLKQEQLEEIGSDKIPSLPWDPGVHLTSGMSDYRVTQVASREPHMPPWVGLEWAYRDLSDGARKLFTFGHDDQMWRWLDWYLFYRDVFTDTVSRQ
jgi:hypothetical protein